MDGADGGEQNNGSAEHADVGESDQGQQRDRETGASETRFFQQVMDRGEQKREPDQGQAVLLKIAEHAEHRRSQTGGRRRKQGDGLILISGLRPVADEQVDGDRREGREQAVGELDGGRDRPIQGESGELGEQPREGGVQVEDDGRSGMPRRPRLSRARA